MESRGNSAGRQYAAAPSVRTPEPARALWRLLAGKDNENASVQRVNVAHSGGLLYTLNDERYDYAFAAHKKQKNLPLLKRSQKPHVDR